MLVKARAATSVKDRTQLPLETFLELAVGQKVLASVEYVRIKATTGAANFALLRLKNLGISGMLHCTQMAGPFQASVGDTIEVWIRQVMPERREVVFTQYQVRLPGDPLIHTVAISHLSPTGIADMLLGKATVDAACRAAEEINRLQGLPPLPARPDTTLSKRTAIGTYNRLIESLGLIDTPSIPAPELAQGLTYGDVAKELGYDIEHIINAAGHMIGDTETYHLGMSILPSGFTPTETSAFPAEHKEAFIRECLERADKNWSKQLDLEAALKPDCLSLAHLAKHMGISEAELLTLMTEKGIQPKVQVVLSKDDIKALEGAN
jgi:hypothetical protein